MEKENNCTHEQTKVFYVGENVVEKVLRLFSNTKSRIDACVDHTRPSLAIETEGAKDSFIDARNRGITSRFITEVTNDNISYCKEMTKLVDELRHIDGIKGNFYGYLTVGNGTRYGCETHTLPELAENGILVK